MNSLTKSLPSSDRFWSVPAPALSIRSRMSVEQVLRHWPPNANIFETEYPKEPYSRRVTATRLRMESQTIRRTTTVATEAESAEERTKEVPGITAENHFLPEPRSGRSSSPTDR